MVTRLVTLLLSLCLASPGLAAVAWDATSAPASAQSGTGNITFNHTVTGSNTYILCTVPLNNAISVSALTYNGTTLAQLGTSTMSGVQTVEQWGLKSPSTGTNTVSITTTGTTTSWDVSCMSFTGVDQTTPTGTTVTNNGSATTITVTCSSAADGMVVDGFSLDASDTITVGAGQTQAANRVFPTAGSNTGASSYQAGAASVVMDWTGNASTAAWASICTPLVAATGGGAETFGFRLRLRQ